MLLPNIWSTVLLSKNEIAKVWRSVEWNSENHWLVGLLQGFWSTTFVMFLFGLTVLLCKPVLTHFFQTYLIYAAQYLSHITVWLLFSSQQILTSFSSIFPIVMPDVCTFQFSLLAALYPVTNIIIRRLCGYFSVVLQLILTIIQWYFRNHLFRDVWLRNIAAIYAYLKVHHMVQLQSQFIIN